jgi:hypothetical protein
MSLRATGCCVRRAIRRALAQLRELNSAESAGFASLGSIAILDVTRLRTNGNRAASRNVNYIAEASQAANR